MAAIVGQGTPRAPSTLPRMDPDADAPLADLAPTLARPRSPWLPRRAGSDLLRPAYARVARLIDFPAR